MSTSAAIFNKSAKSDKQANWQVNSKLNFTIQVSYTLKKRLGLIKEVRTTIDKAEISCYIKARVELGFIILINLRGKWKLGLKTMKIKIISIKKTNKTSNA